jgi:hypothetical protein
MVIIRWLTGFQRRQKVMPRGFAPKLKIGKAPKMVKGISPGGLPKIPQSRAMPFKQGKLVNETPVVKAPGRQRKI